MFEAVFLRPASAPSEGAGGKTDSTDDGTNWSGQDPVQDPGPGVSEDGGPFFGGPSARGAGGCIVAEPGRETGPQAAEQPVHLEGGDGATPSGRV